MWFIPSYGRPSALVALLKAPGGMPADTVVIVNEDDPKIGEYKSLDIPWSVETIPAGSRICDAWRHVYRQYPLATFYGLLSDDTVPITPGWIEKMQDAAGRDRIAIANGSPKFPLIRSAVCIGGDLVRAMGFLVPDGFRHNYVDNVWDVIVQDFNVGVPLKDVVIEHRHPLFCLADMDDTYQRGSRDILEDRATFHRWMESEDRIRMSERVAAFLGRNVSFLNPKTVRLAICLLAHDGRDHKGFTQSLRATMAVLNSYNIETVLVELSGGSNVGKARESVLWDAMSTNPTHLLYIDSDMTWDPELVMKLLAADHDFCAVPGAKKQDDPQLACNFLPNPQVFHKVSKFLKIRDVGFAFTMLKRTVIDQMCAAYPELQYQTGDGSKQWALFIEMIDRDFVPEGERLSEDLSFCRRWCRIGGSIFIDPNASVGHIGQKEYRASASMFFDKPDSVAMAA